jgi:hypothetical protein
MKPQMQGKSSPLAWCNKICGVILLLIGCAGVALYSMFTPVYKPISCDVSAGLDGIYIPGVWPLGLNPSSDASLAVQINLRCSNPNPISLVIHKAFGTVYVGKDKLVLDTAVAMPESYLHANSKGSIFTESTIRLDPAMVAKVFPDMLLGNGVPILFELDGRATISLPFLFGASGTPLIRFSCGMTLASAPHMIVNPDAPIMGPMTCADTLTRVDVLPVDADDDKMFDRSIALAESVKNVVTSTMMLLGFVCGPILLCWGSQSCCCCLCRRRQQAREVVASKVDAQTVGAHSHSATLPARGVDAHFDV